jgi:hypothetical protein
VNFFQTNPAVSFAVVRARDGAITTLTAGENVLDEAWSPASRHIGYSVISGQGQGQRQRAIVRDAETGQIALEVDGRFAGWSPDGLWIYVARNEGLFARRLDGGELARFSLYGVPVSATKP